MTPFSISPLFLKSHCCVSLCVYVITLCVYCQVHFSVCVIFYLLLVLGVVYLRQKGVRHVNERFKELRKALGLTQSEFGKILMITTSGVSDIESGRRNVTEQHVKLLCVEPIQGKQVNEDWLRNGSGEMFKERSPAEEIGYYVEDLLEYDGQGNPFYDMIVEMMKTYVELDEKSQAVIRDYFQSVSDGIHKKEKEDH